LHRFFLIIDKLRPKTGKDFCLFADSKIVLKLNNLFGLRNLLEDESIKRIVSQTETLPGLPAIYTLENLGVADRINDWQAVCKELTERNV
jgi:hypothetical protein